MLFYRQDPLPCVTCCMHDPAWHKSPPCLTELTPTCLWLAEPTLRLPLCGAVWCLCLVITLCFLWTAYVCSGSLLSCCVSSIFSRCFLHFSGLLLDYLRKFLILFHLLSHDASLWSILLYFTPLDPSSQYDFGYSVSTWWLCDLSFSVLNSWLLFSLLLPHPPRTAKIHLY